MGSQQVGGPGDGALEPGRFHDDCDDLGGFEQAGGDPPVTALATGEARPGLIARGPSSPQATAGGAVELPGDCESLNGCIEVAAQCGIDNVRVVRGRAEEVAESVEADVVTARAVAAIDKLVKWCSPLLSPQGRLVLLKGRSAADELDRAKYTLRKQRFSGEIYTAGTIEGVEPTTVVVLTRS